MLPLLDRVAFFPSRKLPDDPKADWKVSLVSSVIVKHMSLHSFNMVCSLLSKQWLFCHFLFDANKLLYSSAILRTNPMNCFDLF